MKFNFKIQQYQTDAVENTVAVFAGQPCQDRFIYRRDLGQKDAGQITYDDDYVGFSNADIELSDQDIFAGIRNIQESNDIPLSKALSNGLGRVGLDIEMETGTGKTYVYIKTMFELNKRYGWSKFIVVVPSIAIREGVPRVSGCLRSTLWSTTVKRRDTSSTTVPIFSSSIPFQVMPA